MPPGPKRRAAGGRTRRAKRARAAAAAPHNRIQSRGAKRKNLGASARTIPSCGAKRARTALGGGGGGSPPPALSAGHSLPYNNRCVHLPDFRRDYCFDPVRDPIPCSNIGVGGGGSCTVDPIPCSNSGGGGAVDWANLGDGPAGLIAELALASDVADYIRFRAVCRPWRRCTADPRAERGLDGRFLPRRWIMLDKALDGHRCRRFLNVSTGESIRMDLPELAEHRLVAFAPEGLLVLYHEATLVLRLLNPLTRQLTDLPPVPAKLRRSWDATERGPILCVCAVGLIADGSTVAVAFSWPMVLAIAAPGDGNWTVVNGGYYIASALPFAGRMYCATPLGVVMLHHSSDERPPQLLMAAEPRQPLYFGSMTQSLHLVDNGGELMMVHRKPSPANYAHTRSLYEMTYDVYKVDLDAGVLIPSNGLNGRAVFVGTCRTISISPDVFPYVRADTIYVGVDLDEWTTMIGYNLVDGSRERRCYARARGRMQPRTVVDCLSYCVHKAVERLII
ncbi:hypothetical protein ACP4OV_018724 [Aristida adscensionis]